ncbi:ADP-ribosylation factor-like protein 4D [Portunus trituberculatus]|uniref:ADP-ribosylation factor-like protein 4D n=1 Tax=Portunus trituberculatus TaxID=210409 RepID=A0A5B7JNN9_PORTR|nr:ADP-ribosylation factor-like protein 4D [Portunus trituberculatus]
MTNTHNPPPLAHLPTFCTTGSPHALPQVPILVLANKQDLPGAKDPLEIERLLGIAELGNTHLWHIQVREPRGHSRENIRKETQNTQYKHRRMRERR